MLAAASITDIVLESLLTTWNVFVYRLRALYRLFNPNNGDHFYTTSAAERDDAIHQILLRNGDVYEISEITGTIWAGVKLTGRNGPDGWANRVDYDTKFPLHGGMDPVNAHPYCLLGKLRNYFFIGSRGRGKVRFIYPQLAGLMPNVGTPNEGFPLHLRINDDRPGNGNGRFSCRIRVWRA